MRNVIAPVLALFVLLGAYHIYRNGTGFVDYGAAQRRNAQPIRPGETPESWRAERKALGTDDGADIKIKPATATAGR